MTLSDVVTKLEFNASQISNCSMVGIGDIRLFDDKASTMYPYINLDIISDEVFNGSIKAWKFRIYAVDRNEPYLAYNKCELMIGELLNQMEILDYTLNYITLNYQDLIHGVFTDVSFDASLTVNCN